MNILRFLGPSYPPRPSLPINRDNWDDEHWEAWHEYQAACAVAKENFDKELAFNAAVARAKARGLTGDALEVYIERLLNV
jgi:hypothetical protein